MTRIVAGLGGDVRFAARMLAKNKGFTATALTTLALCIGANTAVFSMLYALVLKPLPFREPARIVDIYNSFPKVGLENTPSNVAQYLDFKANTDAFAHLGLWQLEEATLGEEGGSARLSAARATTEMFDVLGVDPVLGRFFTAENHVPAASHVVVLTQAFWISQFQEAPGVLGQTLRIDGETYEIVGVAPHAFSAFDARVKFVRPLAWPPDRVAQFPRYGVSPRLYGRLKPEATLGAALAQVEALEQQYYDAAPPPVRDFLDRSGHVIRVANVQAQRIRPVKEYFYLLEGGVAIVLLIGCVNVANLLLARSNARRSEIATRVALGAGRATIARQLLVESLLLTWLGAALGLGLAWAALGAANHLTAQLLPNALPFAIDGRMLALTAVVATAMALGIGLLPVVHVLGGNLLALLQSQGRGASGGRGVRLTSSVLVVVQMAIALVLLTAAGLSIRSFARVLGVDPGFDARNVVTARLALSADYRRENRLITFQQQLLDALREIPGLDSVSVATATPFQQDKPINAFSLRDYTLPDGAAQPGAFHFGASPAYLETLQIPLLEGRWFNETDTESSRRVYVVDEDFAHRYFEGRSAIGQHLTFGGVPEKPEDWPEIIGVVGNVLHNGVEPEFGHGNPYLYHPLSQTPSGGLSIFVRTLRPVPDVLALIRDKVRALDPDLPVYQAGTLEEVVGASFSNRRAIMWVLGGMAGIALVLSAVGIYGVLAYDVSQRTREIGIRGAIGATSGQVVVMVLKQGLWKTGLGIVFGLAGALLLSRFMTRLLYEVGATDPVSYLAVTAVLLVVAMVASYLPARRAARIDPIIALRSE